MRVAVATIGTRQRQIVAAGFRIHAIGKRDVGGLVVAIQDPGILGADHIRVVVGAACRTGVAHLQFDVVRWQQ